MRIASILLLALVCACGPEVPLELTLRPWLHDAPSGGELRVNGALHAAGKEWTITWDDRDDITRVDVELWVEGRPIERARITPLEHCARHMGRLAGDGEIVRETMEVAILSPAFRARGRGFTDGPCISCGTADGKGFGGCGGGAISEPVAE